jgi:hypothetical protein
MKWIACKDKEPPDGCDAYLVSNKYGQVYIADRNMRYGKWIWYDPRDDCVIGLTYGYPVTHWMPLPEPPTKENDQ